MKHELKTLPGYFAAVLRGKKKFEVRKDDRNYKVGDTLKLKEYARPQYDKPLEYTGRYILADVTYVFRNKGDIQALQPGYCVMSIKVTAKGTEAQISDDLASVHTMD